MLNDLMMLAESVPATGDNFPAVKLIIIGGAALAVMVGAAVFAHIKNDKDDE